MVMILLSEWAQLFLKSYICRKWNTSCHCRCFSGGAWNISQLNVDTHSYRACPVDATTSAHTAFIANKLDDDDWNISVSRDNEMCVFINLDETGIVKPSIIKY